MVKVFCTHCKYHGDQEFRDDYCDHPSNTYEKETYYETYIIRKTGANTLNENNDCKNFKKSWWRVVVAYLQG